MKKVWITMLLIAGVALATGCDKSPTETPETSNLAEQEVLEALSEELDFLPGEFRDNEFDTGAQPQSLSDGSPGVAEAIEPLRFGRRILERAIDREVELTSDTTAVVTLHYELGGVLHILGATATDTSHYQKDFSDTAVRYVYMEKRQPRPHELDRTDRPPLPADRPAHLHRPYRWRLTGISGTLIQSPEGQAAIESIQISSESVDATISDILATIDRDNIVTIPRGETVTITVTTSQSDENVFAHVRPRHRHRLALESNSDNTHSVTFTAVRPGIHHMMVNTMSHDTLHESDAAYDSMGWGFNYRVARQ